MEGIWSVKHKKTSITWHGEKERGKIGPETKHLKRKETAPCVPRLWGEPTPPVMGIQLHTQHNSVMQSFFFDATKKGEGDMV